jgi:limonene 1,2-monooxygenase
MERPFGIFMAPFHPAGQNPTLAIWSYSASDAPVDEEAWIGAHHSAGLGIIAAPEVFIAVASQRTRHIRLETGVVSLPSHHLSILADRMVLLHRAGRVIIRRLYDGHRSRNPA